MLLLIASAALFLHAMLYGFQDDIWYDEVFSLSFAKMSFSDIAAFTARDVHPPFYYFYLKVVTSIATAILGKDCYIVAAKLASGLPWIGLFILALTYIRKRFSLFTSGLFIFLITVMPQIPTYYVEIRMYSLALLFITGHILVADRFLNTDKDKKNLFLWGLFFILGLMTAYTQYYACIATIGIYVGTGIVAFLKTKDKKNSIIKGLFITAFLSVLTYMPWLPVLKRQMENISGKYWIQPLTLRSILGCIKFITLPVVYAGKLPVISAALIIGAMGAVFAVLLFRTIRNREKEHAELFILLLMPVFIVVLSGFVLSALGTPIFVYRYLVPALGGFWLFFAYALDRMIDTEKRLWGLLYLLLIPFVLVGALNYKGFCDEEGKKVAEMQRAAKVVDKLPTDAVIITNFDHVTAVMGYYLPDNEVYLYNAQIDRLLPDMHESIREDMQDDAIKYLLESHRKVYFFGSFNSREDIIKDWEKLGIKVSEEYSILIERYWINVYKLSL